MNGEGANKETVGTVGPTVAGGWHERATRGEKTEKKRSSRPADPELRRTGVDNRERSAFRFFGRARNEEGRKGLPTLSLSSFFFSFPFLTLRSTAERGTKVAKRESKKRKREKEMAEREKRRRRRRTEDGRILEQGARHCVRPPTATVERRTLSVRAAGSQLVRSNTLRSLSFAAERSPSAKIGSKQNYKLCALPLCPAVPLPAAVQCLLLLGPAYTPRGPRLHTALVHRCTENTTRRDETRCDATRLVVPLSLYPTRVLLALLARTRPDRSFFSCPRFSLLFCQGEWLISTSSSV